MRLVIQRVKEASVEVEGETIASIGRGVVVLIGVGKGDGEEDVRYLAEKLLNLRIFPDKEGRMNLSLEEIGGEVLAVSQFTLYGDVRKGRRPSFTQAAPPREAERLYRMLVTQIREEGIKVETGKFQAHMLVKIFNDGPVTFIMESKT